MENEYIFWRDLLKEQLEKVKKTINLEAVTNPEEIFLNTCKRVSCGDLPGGDVIAEKYLEEYNQFYLSKYYKRYGQTENF